MRSLIDKLGVRPGARVALVSLDEPWFENLLRERTGDVIKSSLRGVFDMIVVGVERPADLGRIVKLKASIKPDGAIWVIRRKGDGRALSDTDIIAAGLAAGLVDNKIASFSETLSAMRLVYRLRDRPALMKTATPSAPRAR